MRSDRRGIALLEVLAAVAILGLAGLALLQLITGESRALAEVRLRETELADEDRLLTAHTLLLRTELERRIGRTVTGPYVVDIQRPEPALFRIAVARVTHPLNDDLVTVVYRPESDSAR